MKDLKNIGKLLAMAAYILGAIGGFGYCIYSHAYLIAAAIIVLAVMAWPTFRKMWPSKEA